MCLNLTQIFNKVLVTLAATIIIISANIGSEDDTEEPLDASVSYF